MTSKKPNKLIAPVIIAGITVGFLASAYKFVFAKKEKRQAKEEQQGREQTDQDLQDGHS